MKEAGSVSYPAFSVFTVKNYYSVVGGGVCAGRVLSIKDAE